MDDPQDYIGLIIGALVLLAQLVARLGKGRPLGALAEQPEREAKRSKSKGAKAKPGRTAARDEDRAEAARRAARKAAAAAEASKKMIDRLDAQRRRAAELAEAVRLERPNRRFADTLKGFVPQEIDRIRQGVLRAGRIKDANPAADAMDLVLGEIELLARQRRDPDLLAQLGDADAFADACYAPVIAFAHAEGLPLTSGHPVTQLGGFDLAVWTGFIPTSLAPIFLPADFFSNALWWPAVAHEVGHDFLASVQGLEPALRRELGLPDEATGTRPLRLDGGDIDAMELGRVVGGWFEEIFCDVFGTLMCGPAYVTSMTALFEADRHPWEVITVHTDPSGMRYGTHPPAHLRVLVGCRILDRAGFSAEALALREAWEARHAADGKPLDRILFPLTSTFLAVPISFYEEVIGEIVERLYSGPLRALSSFGLQDISGLDYGPHEHMEAARARDALLAGRVPRVRAVRAVIAGATLATAAQPAAAAEILRRARAAIPAVGTGEQRPDAFHQPADAAPAGTAAPLGADRTEVLEALVLREALAPPRGLRWPRRRAGL